MCEICKSDRIELLNQLLNCRVLMEECTNLANNTGVEYEDIFEYINKQIPVAKLFSETLDKRTKLLEL